MQRHLWDSVIESHLGCAYNLTRAVINPMRQRGYGRIILVAGNIRPSRSTGQIAKIAAAGVAGLTRQLAIENAHCGITVNCVQPGFLELNSTVEMGAGEWERTMSAIPMKRAGRPEEVAHLIGFLASDQAAYITGQVIEIDGGLAL
jgi:3-oxoacyl-[acyl-carrier protein] reductase